MKLSLESWDDVEGKSEVNSALHGASFSRAENDQPEKQMSNKLNCKTFVPLVFLLRTGRCLSRKTSSLADRWSCVVYKFLCEGCNVCYVSETTFRQLFWFSNSHHLAHDQSTAVVSLLCSNSFYLSCLLLVSSKTKAIKRQLLFTFVRSGCWAKILTNYDFFPFVRCVNIQNYIQTAFKAPWCIVL